MGLRGSDGTYDRQSNRAETGDWRRAVVVLCDQDPSVPRSSLLSGGCPCQMSSGDCVCTLYLMKSSDKIHCDSEFCLWTLLCFAEEQSKNAGRGPPGARISCGAREGKSEGVMMQVASRQILWLCFGSYKLQVLMMMMKQLWEIQIK